MTKAEVMGTKYGEFLDLLSCLSIYKGFAKEKHQLSFDEILNLR